MLGYITPDLDTKPMYFGSITEVWTQNHNKNIKIIEKNNIKSF